VNLEKQKIKGTQDKQLGFKSCLRGTYGETADQKNVWAGSGGMAATLPECGNSVSLAVKVRGCPGCVVAKGWKGKWVMGQEMRMTGKKMRMMGTTERWQR